MTEDCPYPPHKHGKHEWFLMGDGRYRCPCSKIRGTMTDHPILFSGPMVRAILEDRKTQTRRVIKRPDRYRNWEVGDRLWIRETWAPMCRVADPCCWKEFDEEAQAHHDEENHYTEYRADTSNPIPRGWPEEFRGGDGVPKWKPSIHMPRKASRITLEITRLWEERLDDMKLTDMVEEGIPFDGSLGKLNADWIKLWDSINDKRGYGSHLNPPVKVIAFKRVIL